MSDEAKALVEQLEALAVNAEGQDDWLVMSDAADLIETQAREIERLNDAMREAINTVSDLARKVGEAEGKLAISETAGVLDGWMAENARLLASVKAWAADAARHSDNADYWRQECQMLREALEWALAEVEGRTRYSPNNIYDAEEQKSNALDCARAALGDRP